MAEEKSENLVKHYSGLTLNERVMLCNLLKGQYPTIHVGSLPFIRLDVAIERLHHYQVHGQLMGMRLVRQILSKLPDTRTVKTYETFIMCLDDKKVYRRFGRNPERGKPLPHLNKVKVTVGFRWSLPKCSWVPDTDVLVTPTIALKRKGRGQWEVTVTRNCRAATEQWLFENCRSNGR